MYKQLVLNVKLLKDYYAFIIFPLIAVVIGIWERGSFIPQSDNENIIYATSLAKSFAVMACFLFFSSIFQKQYNLKKYKLSKWYYSLPISKQNLILSDIIFVVLSHVFGMLFWVIYLFIKGTPELFGVMVMPCAVSLIVISIYLIIYYRFGDETNLIASIIYVALVALTFMFHSFLVQNDHVMALNLSKEAGWNFYLYQLPYIALAIGLILLVAAYFIINRSYHRKHQFA